MAKYCLLLQGAGEGCDYSIDCNKSFKLFEASSEAHALKIAEKLVAEYDSEQMDKALLIEIKKSKTIDLKECLDVDEVEVQDEL
jgi:hypothetical protein